MKRIRPLFLVLILVLVAGGGYYYLRVHKKKKVSKPKPSPVHAATPLPLEALEPSPVALPKSPAPPASPAPGLPPGAESQASLPPSGLVPSSPAPSFPGEALPRAESLATESQPLIQLSMGNPIRIAEGSTLDLDQVSLQYGGKAKLDYQWKVVSGPAELIDIQGPKDLKPRVTLKNMEQANEFVLRLSVTDRQTEATGEIKISVVPARLELKAVAGGAFVGIQHMGDKWVAARGDTVEVYDGNMSLLAQAKAGFPITQFFGMMGPDAKGSLYVQAPEGPWVVLQNDPVQGASKTPLPMLGRNIRRVVPFQMDGAPYMFALLEHSIDLWNLSDPKHPRLKTSLGTFLKDPLYLAFAQRNLYVAEEASIHLIDFSTGNLIASVPSGGSVTSLATFSGNGKNYLVASIGRDRTKQNRKDYGLRIFEIAPNGRLEGERRLSLGENLPVEKVLVIPGPGLALASVLGPKGWGLEMADLAAFKEITLNAPAELNFLALGEIETGKIKDQPVAVVADGNQLRVLEFKGQGSPPSAFFFSQINSIPSILSAGWVQSTEDASRVIVGDPGTLQGGALAFMDALSWQVKQTLNAPEGSFPADADLSVPAPPFPAFYIAEDIKAQIPRNPEGRLALVSLEEKTGPSVALSGVFLGTAGPQGVLRPAGLAARQLEDRLRIVVAMAKFSGNLGGSGLVVLDKTKEQSSTAFLQSDLAKNQVLIPLQDARDVALSQDGKTAFVAAGTYGLIAVDLEKKAPVSRMSLGSNDWVADGVLLGHQGNLVLTSFINPSTRRVLIKIFGIEKGNQLQEYGTIADLPGLSTVAGSRSPRPALTQDDLYLFMPTQERVLTVFNLSNPGQPQAIAQAELDGEIRAVAVANRFKDVFVTLGQAGIAKLEFGF